ncbi:MAG: hypothetical protein AB1810_13880 [Pseudomonadota bacterium]
MTMATMSGVGKRGGKNPFRWIEAGVIAAFAAFLLSFGLQPRQPAPLNDAQIAAARQALVDNLLAYHPVKPREAWWLAGNTLQLGIDDNGKNRDGDAASVCVVSESYGFKGRGLTVVLVDAGQVKNPDALMLGRWQCR